MFGDADDFKYFREQTAWYESVKSFRDKEWFGHDAIQRVTSRTVE